jgi:hypothetical protein
VTPRHRPIIKIIRYASGHNGPAQNDVELPRTAENHRADLQVRVSSQVGSVRRVIQLPPRPPHPRRSGPARSIRPRLGHLWVPQLLTEARRTTNVAVAMTPSRTTSRVPARKAGFAAC